MLSIHDSPRWSACSASAAPTNYLLPADPPSEMTLEGRAARWAADCILYGDATSAEELTGKAAPGGYVVTAQLAEYVAEYVDAVEGMRPDPAGRQVLHLGTMAGGEHDCDIAVGADGILRVIMMAVGWRVIDVANEPRLLLPALAWADSSHTSAQLWVFQPRPHHRDGTWRTVEFSRDDLSAAVAWLVAKHAETENAMAPANVNRLCAGCRRRSRCATLEGNVYAQYELLETRCYNRPMTAPELAAELRFLDRALNAIEARRSGVRAEADARIREEHLPGWLHQEMPGKRELSVAPEVASFVLGHPASKVVPKTPHELEKEGVSAARLKPLTRRRRGHVALVEFDPQDIRRSFKNG